MKNPNIKISDLVKLEGLEKPQGGVKIPIWGKPEKVDELGEAMGDFAGKIEDQQDVRVGEVGELVGSVKELLIKRLSLEQVEETLETLKKRFLDRQKPYKSAEGIKWEDVEKKLRDAPGKLWSLNEMEKTGGEPDLMEFDQKTGEYIFMDCSEESPQGRRGCVYDREDRDILKRENPINVPNGTVVGLAAFMGIKVLSQAEYRELQTKGKFDKETMSWLKTPVDQRKVGRALCGRLSASDRLRVEEFGSRIPSHNIGWRGSLRV